MAAALLLPFAAHAAAPPAPVTQTLTCPVGGERFPFTTLSAYATWGQRPDGKPVQSQALYFSQGPRVYQAVIYADRLSADVADTFFGGLRLP